MDIELPDEIWRHVFSFLWFEDLSSLCLTSKRMNGIATAPSLWKSKGVHWKNIARSGRAAEFLAIKRFRQIDFVTISCAKKKEKPLDCNDLVGQAMRLEQFKRIVVCYHSLHLIPVEVLSNSTSHLRELVLLGNIITIDQLEGLIRSVPKSRTLEVLSLNTNPNLATIAPRELGLLVTPWLRKLSLVAVSPLTLTNDQLEEIFRCVLRSETMEELNLARNVVGSVSTELVGSAIKTLTKLNISSAGLSRHFLYSAIDSALSSTTLCELDITGNWNIMHVNEEFVDEAKRQLGARLRYTKSFVRAIMKGTPCVMDVVNV